MKQKMLITGGSGSVGSAFINYYGSNYDISIISRNEMMQSDLKRRFPDVECYLGSVESRDFVYSVYDRVKPEIVIHAAALKHVNLAEPQPIQTCNINVIGSMNVVAASRLFRTPYSIAISTDKACNPENVYGASKLLMERCFLEANTAETRMTVCRFANVAHSNGSVIPFWLQQSKEGKALQVTSVDMCRMMFSQAEAAALIMKGIKLCENKNSPPFVLCRKMKAVRIIDLAKAISDNVSVIGLRAGEKLYEELISERELPFTKLLEDDYITIELAQNKDASTRLDKPYNTNTAPIMSADEIKTLISAVSV